MAESRFTPPPGMQISEMAEMTDEEYRDHVAEFGLFFVDPHGCLRASPVEFPLATSKLQLDILLDELKKIRPLLP